jgi:hypothetical protein
MILGVSLVGSIATMAGAMYTPPERPIQKHLLWLVRGWITMVVVSIVNRISGFQCLSSGHPESPVFLQSSHPLTGGSLHCRRRWVDIVHRRHSHVGLLAKFSVRIRSLTLVLYHRNDKYLHLGGPLLAGVTVVALSSLAPMVLPLGLRGLAISESISLYGGLAVFGGFVLYE